MKVLNLDKLNKKVSRELVLNNVTHVVGGMTVDNFIVTTATAEALANETSLVKQVEATVEMVLRSIPTVPVEELRALELEQLQAIVAFIRGDAVEGAEAAAQSAEGEGDEKKA